MTGDGSRPARLVHLEPSAHTSAQPSVPFFCFFSSVPCHPDAGGTVVREPTVARAPAEQKSRQLLLLGGFELRWAGGPVRVQRSGQRLLALLALQRRPLERLYVAGTLWLDASEERAGASLRSALWRLPQPGGSPVVQTSVTHLRLAVISTSTTCRPGWSTWRRGRTRSTTCPRCLS